MRVSRVRALIAAAIALAIAAALAAPALADFPYARPGAAGGDYTDLYLTDEVPDDICGDSNEFKYSASADPANQVNNSRGEIELDGVRGAHVVDKARTGCHDDEPRPYAASDRPTAWRITTGRPDVTLAVLDSGVKWNDRGAMGDLRRKTRLNKGEMPPPQGCSEYDCNGDRVFNVEDYAEDPRVTAVVNGDSRRDGPPGVLTPQDVLIAFSDGTDADSNGYVDDMVGWDFLDNDNDPFDDVQYGHGTGEARGSTSEANNDAEGDNAGSCPNCMVIHMRVGDSFIADVNRFAAAVTYATDNGVEVVQSALGTLNNSTISRQAVEYAYDHGVTVILSAADEAAQHNNQPSLPHSILVNSVTRDPIPAPNQSYLDFNGCTNFNVKITVAIPSTSCSSDAVGVSSGLAGLIYSAAYNAFDKGKLNPNTRCTLTGDGPDAGGGGPDDCVITPSEVRQLLASGRIDGQTMVDDIDFAGLGDPDGPEPDCTPPTLGCTDPNLALQSLVDLNRPRLIPNSFSYPARTGHDQFYGYGRVNTRRSVEALLDDPASPTRPSLVPPEVELTSPQWYEQVDPARSSFDVTGEVWARGGEFTCRVLVAPGHYPNQGEAPDGDFTAVSSPGVCDGVTTHTQALDGKLADVSTATLKSLFPPDASQGPAMDFKGRETGATGVQTSGGRPNTDPYGFEVKVVATTTQQNTELSGEDYRGAFLHRDQDMLPGFPKAIGGGSVAPSPATPTSDGASSPAFADLDGDNANELVFGSSDGFVHALRPDGAELPGWPVRGDRPPFVESHLGARAYESGEVSSNAGGAMLASVAIGDANHDGLLEVYAADLEGKVYGWSAEGERIFETESNPAFSGAPLEPFIENRKGSFNRTQHGFIGSPVLADLDRDDGGRMEVVAASMDRHVYAWEHDGSAVEGFPALVVDPEKVDLDDEDHDGLRGSVDPRTHRITFEGDAGSEQQGGIIATPAVGDLDGDPNDQGEDELPEIVVGTNEEYRSAADGGFNGGIANGASLNLIDQAQAAINEFLARCDAQFGGQCSRNFDNPLPLEPGNTRLYALSARGDRDDDPLPGIETLRPGWPTKLGMALTGLLPIVGEGVAGAPVIAPAACGQDGAAVEPRVGAAANNGPAYVLSENGDSCYGKDPQNRDIPLQTDVAAGSQYDHPFLPAVGNPTFGDLGEGSPSFLLPAAGLFRALDLGLPEYQRGQDYIGAWSVTGGGQFRPNFPATMNDLQFLTGPAVADLDGRTGEEVIEGSASKEVTALTAAGTPVNDRWPKVTSDWTVATPLVGSFGEKLDTDPAARKVVVNLTRSGYVHAYGTEAPACSPSSSPRFHHDNANSGDFSRDAVLPGKPMELSFAAGEVSFSAPGDDLLCGTAEEYELATSNAPIDEGNFDEATPLEGAPDPVAAGESASFDLPDEAERYLAIRAVDDQGNVGRVASIEVRPGSGGPGGNETDPGDTGPGQSDPGDTGPGQSGDGETDPGETRPGEETAPDGDPPTTLPAPGPCSNRVEGTPGKDRLRGTDGPDRLRGRGGADRLLALGGDDCVKPGRGADRVKAGAGSDRVEARDGERDRIRCGRGKDVAIVDALDRVKGCERVRRSG